MGDRCTGGCCREFHLPSGPDELAGRALGYFLLAEYDAPFWREGHLANAVELAKIAQLAVPTRLLHKGEPTPAGRPYEGEAPAQLYTCRWFDGRSCTVYETRPAMCRRYPYGSPCEHGDNCEWDAARLGKVDAEGRVLRHLPVLVPEVEPAEGPFERVTEVE